MIPKLSRRKLLGLGLGSASALASTSIVSGGISKAFAAACGLTPPQTPGPFYPGEDKFTENTDLTQVPGKLLRAKGQIIYVRGQVLDQHCRPVAGATVEIWQACTSGRYNNPKDTNPAELDPGFRYWGEAITDQNGEYVFKSIIPGAYPADTNWTRPPHIHYKISKLGYHELVTQLYFKGNQYNDTDLILQKVPSNLRDSVIVDFQPAPADFEPGALMGRFNITLESVR